jgi:hypothetical protein
VHLTWTGLSRLFLERGMNSQEHQLLASFLPTLFPGGALRRFTSLEFGESIAHALSPEMSSADQAFALVEELDKRGAVNHPFFDAIEKHHPERKQDIDRLRGLLLQPDEPALETQPRVEAAAHGNDERAAWQRKVKIMLAAAPKAAPEPAKRWLYAAAVLPHFAPATLHPLQEKGGEEGGGDLVELAAMCDVRADGRWALRLNPRKKAFLELWLKDRIREALDANPHESSRHTELLRRFLLDKSIELRGDEDYQTLIAAQDLVDWFAETGVRPLDADRLAARIERMETITPFRKLTGQHFRGRELELGALRAHAAPEPGTSQTLVLEGLGGTGKSALLGKFLLELEAQQEPVRFWTYLDFDDPRVDPTEPKRMIERMARQLALLADSRRERDILTGVESRAAGDTLHVSAWTQPVGNSPTELLQGVHKSIQSLSEPPSLLIIFDTIEQVQQQGARTVEMTRQFVSEILETIPYARFPTRA